MFNNRYLDTVMLICVILSITCSSIIIINPIGNIKDDNTTTLIVNSEENIQNTIKTADDGEDPDEFPKAEKYFPFGTNIVWGWMNGLISRQGIDKIEWIETALDDMQAHHINALHFNTLLYEEDLELFHYLAGLRGIRLYPQAGGLPYYFPTWLPEEERNNAFVTRAMPAYSELINQYRDSRVILAWGICEETEWVFAPELKVWTDYIDGLDPNHPALVCYNKMGAIKAASEVIKPRIIPIDIYPFFDDPNHGPTTPSESLSYYQSMIQFSYNWANKCGAPLWVIAQGMSCYKPSLNTLVWRYPTVNEMHLEAWVAIESGAKGIFYWTYTSTPYDNPDTETIWGLVDRDGNPTEIWETVDDVWVELEPFTKIIVEIDYSPSSIIGNKDEGIRARTFQRPTGTERYIIVVNTDIENSKKTKLELTSSENIYDLRTLEQVTSDQLFNHVLLPGRGNIYLVGNEDDFNQYLNNFTIGYVNNNDESNDNDDVFKGFTNIFNINFLLLLMSGITALVFVVIKRRLSSKPKNPYKYKY